MSYPQFQQGLMWLLVNLVLIEPITLIEILVKNQDQNVSRLKTY